jgi:hypothetical protein
VADVKLAAYSVLDKDSRLVFNEIECNPPTPGLIRFFLNLCRDYGLSARSMTNRKLYAIRREIPSAVGPELIRRRLWPIDNYLK